MTQPIIVFKNNLPNLTVLKLFSQDMGALKTKLQQKFKQAPMMFIGMQVIVDVSAFDAADTMTLDIADLLQFLKDESLNPVALMSDSASYRQHLFQFGIGVLPVLQAKAEQQPNATVASAPSKPAKIAQAATAEEDAPEDKPRKTQYSNQPVSNAGESINQIIRHSIRSGQRIYSLGDLTIIGNVSPGAEIIANGSIHVYGRLSGRAVAGAQGDEKVSIFCQTLDAELVSIAGSYKQLEDIDEAYRQQGVQISLEDEKICFFRYTN